MATDEKLDLILVELRSVKSDVGQMKAHMNALEGKMNTFEDKINADRYDRMDFEWMRRNTEIAVAMTQMVNDRLNFIEKTVVRK